jgi:hypothetical protein
MIAMGAAGKVFFSSFQYRAGKAGGCIAYAFTGYGQRRCARYG